MTGARSPCGRWRAYAPAIGWAALVLFIGSRPTIPLPPTGFRLDLLGHLGMYAVLGFAAAFGWRRAGGSPRSWIVLGLAVLVGMADELIQTTIPGRTAELSDFVADSIGVVIGFVIGARLFARRHTRGEA